MGLQELLTPEDFYDDEFVKDEEALEYIKKVTLNRKLQKVNN